MERSPFLPEKFFYEIDVCHKHSPTAVASATELVHRVTRSVDSAYGRHRRRSELPIRLAFV